MSLSVRRFKASDAHEARRLIIDHFLVLRRQRLVSDVIRNPSSYVLSAAVALPAYFVTKSVRLACTLTPLGPLSVYAFLRLLIYVVENFKYHDMLSDEKFAAYWLQGDSERRLCVVQDDQTGTLVGIGGLSKEDEEGVVELKRMVVHGGYRRRGIARMIMNCLLNDYAKEMKANTVTLITQSSQHESVKLYKDAGFTEYRCHNIGIGPFKLVSTYFMRLELNKWTQKSR